MEWEFTERFALFFFFFFFFLFLRGWGVGILKNIGQNFKRTNEMKNIVDFEGEGNICRVQNCTCLCWMEEIGERKA